MKTLVTGFIIALISFCVQGQSATLYYAKNWEIVPQAEASYYRKCQIESGMIGKNFFIGSVEDYTLDGRLVMTGFYDEHGLKNGEFTFYYPSGQIQAKGKFFTGMRTGTWKYFFKNGQLEREVDFPVAERFKPLADDFEPVSVYDSLGTPILTKGTGNWYFEYEWYGMTDKYIVEGKFLSGKKEGIWTCKLSSGQLLYQEIYRNNKFKEGFVSDGQRQENLPEPVNNKFMPPYKLEVTESFVYRMGTTRKDYPGLSFLPPLPDTTKIQPSRDSAYRNLPEDEKVFYAVDQMAEFPGGAAAMFKFIQKNLRYPPNARRMGVEGNCFLKFIVGNDGAISNIKIVKGINDDLNNEAIRIVSIFPNWKPGYQNGRAVKSQFVLPIPFKLDF